MKGSTISHLPQEVMVIENDRIISIRYVEIITILCDKPYIIVETISKKFYLAQNLTSFCSGLPPFIIQSNKSVFINLLHVNAIQKTRNGYEANIKGTSIPLARRRIAEIRKKYIKIKEGVMLNNNYHICINCRFAT